MSFIYEALKRAEDENERGAVTVQTVARPMFFATRPRWWVWVLLAVLGANAALLVTLLVNRSGTVRVPESVTTMKVERIPRSEGPPMPAVSKPAPPRAVERDTTRAPRTEPKAPAAARAPTSSRAVPAPTATGAPASPPAPAPASAPAAPASPPSPSPKPDPSPPPAGAPASPVAPPAPATPVVRPTSPPVAPPAAPPSAPMTPFRPPVSSIPAPAQPSQGASPLRLQVHVYSDTPAQRMVFINGRRYGEGDRIEGGAVLERITPDGAVVNQNGQRFTISDRP